MYDPEFERAISMVMRDEGGYVNDPDDPGGETKYGISARSYPGVDIQALTADGARAIYWAHWWLPFRFGALPMPFSAKSFDISINCGARKSIAMLQAAAGILGDGEIGPLTIATVERAHPDALWTRYVARIVEHYRVIAVSTPKSMKYLDGWLRRANETVT
jgi:lysozyme family protein